MGRPMSIISARRPVFLAAIFVSCAFLFACSEQAAPPQAQISLDEAADAYLGLALSLGKHDPGFVVSYYGPASRQDQASAEPMELKEIAQRARRTEQAVAGAAPDESPELARRRQFLRAQLRAVAIRADMLGGKHMGFAEEATRVFDATIPDLDARAHITELHGKIDRIMPGQGPLARRIEDFRSKFIIPQDRLAAVMEAAVQECRRRTRAIMDLPQESLEIEYASGVNWLTYNEYRGNGFSVIKINTDLPIYIDRAIEMGCHEGYPGHHVSNLLKDKELVQGKGWTEFSIQTLYSPQSLIEEGIAAYATDVLFPKPERVEFERDVLFELAGFDRAQALRYLELMSLTEELAYADIEGARRYLDAEWDPEYTVRWLMNYRLLSPQRARQRLVVFDTYRSFIVTAYLGKQLVRNYVESVAAAENSAASWRVLRELLLMHVLPSDLRN